MVQNGTEVYPGDILAKIPRATTKTKDITGGLPRVVELFEARHPRGEGGHHRGRWNDSSWPGREGHAPRHRRDLRRAHATSTASRAAVHVNVQEGEHVRAGDPLIDGPIDPHDVLAVLGIKELQKYLVDKIQEVYRSQSVAINDKHIEVICRQMLRSVRA